MLDDSAWSQEFAIEARASALSAMRRRIVRALRASDCSSDETHVIVLAVNEACTNIIRHAYGGDCGKPIRISICNVEGGLRFELLDCAPPIELASVRGRALDDVRPGGLGVNFINEVMHSVAYSHRGEKAGNCVRMIWQRQGGEQEPA